MADMKRIAIYPGSFDPVTNGHLDVLKRASALFDKVIVGIATNTRKGSMFTKEKRKELVEGNLGNFENVEVKIFDGLTVDMARKEGANVLIRGLRAVSDFEYEFQLAQMNRHMDDEIETIFLMPSQDYFYTSSQLIKGVSRFASERVKKFVPENVLRALEESFAKE